MNERSDHRITVAGHEVATALTKVARAEGQLMTWKALTESVTREDAVAYVDARAELRAAELKLVARVKAMRKE